MEISAIVKKISHKASQLEKAEERLAEEQSSFNYNNWNATRESLYQLALDLAKAAEG